MCIHGRRVREKKKKRVSRQFGNFGILNCLEMLLKMHAEGNIPKGYVNVGGNADTKFTETGCHVVFMRSDRKNSVFWGYRGRVCVLLKGTSGELVRRKKNYRLRHHSCKCVMSVFTRHHSEFWRFNLTENLNGYNLTLLPLNPSNWMEVYLHKNFSTLMNFKGEIAFLIIQKLQ